MIGIQATAAQVNSNIGNLAVALRNACQEAVNLQAWVVVQGLPGLEAAGFSAADAQAITTAANYLNTIAAVFFGQVAQTPAFNFDNALADLYGAT